MTAVRLYMRQNDTSPSLAATLQTSDGNPIDLTGATVQFIMRHEAAPQAVKVNHAATIVTPALGKVRYDWQAGDTDTVDVYSAGFVITFPDTTVRSVPSDAVGLEVVINKAL